METTDFLQLIRERGLVQGDVKITFESDFGEDGTQSITAEKGFYYTYENSYVLFPKHDKGGSIDIELDIITDFEIIPRKNVTLNPYVFKDFTNEQYVILAESEERAKKIAESFEDSLSIRLVRDN